MRACQGGVTAQINLCARRKPTQGKAIASGDDKSRFRELVLLGNGLQQVIVEPVVERANRCRIAFEALVGKGIYLVKRNVFHTLMHRIVSRFSVKFEQRAAGGDQGIAEAAAQPFEQGEVGRLVDMDFSLTDAFDQGQPVARDGMTLARAKKRIAGFTVYRNPDNAGGAGNAQSACFCETQRLVVGEAELTGSEIDFHGFLRVDRERKCSFNALSDTVSIHLNCDQYSFS